jgi:D-sedoheptulose 7-phosphate isomerase
VNGRTHLDELRRALDKLEAQLERIERFGEALGRHLLAGGRLLAVGNGGSAAHAQHLTAELVGRYREERPALSALALHAETSSLTAIANDYGLGEAFARQVRAHGRSGDVLVAISTSGASPNVLAAVEAARACGLATWALTGAAPNPLAALCDDGVAIAGETPTVQEVHQVAVHLVCAGVDRVAVGAQAVARIEAGVRVA